MVPRTRYPRHLHACLNVWFLKRRIVMKTTATRLRHGSSVLGVVLMTAVQGQCIAHRVHAFPDVCDGAIWLECSVAVDSIVWSDGQVGFAIQGTAGTYSYEAYDNGAIVASGAPVIQSNGWVIEGIDSYSSDFGFHLLGWASIAHCATSIYESPCCLPGQEDVQVFAVQDGVLPIGPPCSGCANYGCYGTTFMWSQLEFGHEYCVRVVDSHCGVTVDATDQCVIAHSCEGLVLETQVLPSLPGDNTGVIELIEAVPDTTEPYPIYSPVLGMINLISLTEGQPVGVPLINAGTAIWTGLDTGWYVVEFHPNPVCQIARDTLYVPPETNTAVGNEAMRPVLRMAPTLTDGTLRLSSSTGTAPINVRIVDGHGRTVLTGALTPGPFSIEALPPGPYVLVATQGQALLRSRFIKR